MNDNEMGQRLFTEAQHFLSTRFPTTENEGAAALMLADGEVLVSTAPATLNESVSLCHETGALCETYKRDVRVTATMCLCGDARSRLIVLAPCGVCQERLWLYGGDVKCAVPKAGDSTQWDLLPLRHSSPHYWRASFEPAR